MSENPGIFDESKRKTYLDALGRTGHHGEACKVASVSRPTVWRYAQEHPEFQAEMGAAQKKLRRKSDDLLVVLLARGYTNTKAAKTAGIAECTLYERLKDPQFRQRIQEVRNRIMDETVGQLIAMSKKALSALEALIDCDDKKAKVGALRLWKECTIDFSNQYDLAARIDALQHETHVSNPEPPTE